MKKIIYKTENGIAIIHPTKQFYEETLLLISINDSKKKITRTVEEKADDIYTYIAQKDVPEGCEYKIVNESEIPTDRTFRGAWDYGLKEDIPKSKEIWKNKLRSDREPLFTVNDIVLRDASIDNDTEKLNAGKIERDRLRDITKLVDNANTIDEIKAVTV